MLALLLSNSNMDKNEMKFPWSLMFFVTGISLIAFSFAIKLLEGNHSKIMLKAGAAALCAGVLSSLITRERIAKKISKLRSYHNFSKTTFPSIVDTTSKDLLITLTVFTIELSILCAQFIFCVAGSIE